MLVAVFILFIGIVGLVLYLVVQSYSRARSEQYDASSLVEEYANNRMITQQGDVVFCYRLLLPPAYSYTAEAYDQIVEIWRVALKDLPRGTIIMRSDRYDRSYFDASCMPEMSYIQREEKAYARSRLKTNGTSYLFIVYTGFRETRNPKSQNPFVTLSHKEFKEEDGAYSHFLNTLDSMYLQLQGSGLLDIRPLSEPEIREYMHYYFNGYQSDFLTDVYATKRYVRAGDNYVGAVSIEHERQFPEVLRTPYPGRGVKVPIGTLEDLGIGLPFPHICNQIITITGHLTLNPTELELTKGNSRTIQATVEPWVTDVLQWTTSDSGVAVVNSKGVVTAVEKGQCVITATSTLSPEVSATCEVTVSTVCGKNTAFLPLTVT